MKKNETEAKKSKTAIEKSETAAKKSKTVAEKGETAAMKKELEEYLHSSRFLVTCQYAIQVVELKLRMLQEEMAEERRYHVISAISSRIKSAESISRKLERKKLDISVKNAKEKLNDIVGVRATCFFEDDIYELVKRISGQQDIKVIKEKDYIKKPKDNGYKSFHLIVDVPVYNEKGCVSSRVEIQFRTVAMDFWAQLDYQLCYKKEISGKNHKDIEAKLAAYAAEIAKMDSGMVEIRKAIEKID